LKCYYVAVGSANGKRDSETWTWAERDKRIMEAAAVRTSGTLSWIYTIIQKNDSEVCGGCMVDRLLNTGGNETSY
jgi:hypothetical protein